jgi:hypothetical protein
MIGKNSYLNLLIRLIILGSNIIVRSQDDVKAIKAKNAIDLIPECSERRNPENPAAAAKNEAVTGLISSL